MQSTIALNAVLNKPSEAHGGLTLEKRKRSLKAAAVGNVTCPPEVPSFITRVLGVDSGRFRVGQARRARSPQIAQAPGALLLDSDCPVRNAA